MDVLTVTTPPLRRAVVQDPEIQRAFDHVREDVSREIIRTRTTTNVTVPLVSVSGTYDVSGTDCVVCVDTKNTPAIIRLPNRPDIGREVYIKDKAGNAAVNNIIVSVLYGASTIDSLSTYTIAAGYGHVHVVFNGSEWGVL